MSKKAKLAATLVITILLSSCRSNYATIERNSHTYSDSAFIGYLKSEGIAIIPNNNVTVLNGAEMKFDSLLADIEKAKHHIHLEYFNFRNDSINKVLITALARKAKEGVEVRALFDSFGNISNNSPLKKSDLKAIKEQGIEIVEFDPITFPWLNHVLSRDHRKLVVIDGVKAYIGGINVADYYLKGIDGVGQWRDIHARVEGEAVDTLQKIFIDMWQKETGQHLNVNYYTPKHKPNNNTNIAVIDRWPRKTPSRMRDAYANAINSAKENIIIINPYFIPMPKVRKAIEKAIDEGVEVTLLLSSKGDVKMIPHGVWRVGYQLMKRGAKVYIYDQGFNHAKVMCIDGKFCTIGSANLNSRSLRYDYETNIFIFGQEETKELQHYIELDKQKSTELTEEIYKARCWWSRLCGLLVTLATPFI